MNGIFRVASSAPAVELDQPVALTATVSTVGSGGATPTGTVTFRNTAGTLLGSATVQGDGTATLSTTFTVIGTQSISAVYSGDATFSPATASPVVETISKLDAQVTLTSVPAAFTVGQPIAFTASVSPSVAGTATSNRRLA